MEDNEIQEGGISLGDIFRTIFSQKWLALIVAVAIAVIGVVSLYFYNQPKKEYVVSFVMKLPGSEKSPDEYKYPDGTTFYYTELMSAENLKKVKDGSQDFAGVDVDEMVEKGDISIKRETLEVVADSKIYEINYTLTIKAKYFQSADVARNFMVALTNLPVEYLKNMDIDYDTYITASTTAMTYDTQLSYLQNQVTYISALYNSLIGNYNGSFVVKNGKTLSAYKAQLDVFVDNNEISRLKVVARDNGYIKDDSSINAFKSKLSNLERELEKEEAALNALKEFVNADGSYIYASDVINQQKTITSLMQEKKDLEEYLKGKKPDEAFAKEVADLESQIRAFTDEVVEVASIVYSTATTVSFANSTIITVEGGMGLLMIGALSVVLALIVAAIVAFIVGWSKQKKAAAVKTDSNPVYFEAAQAQLAATEDKQEENKEDKE